MTWGRAGAAAALVLACALGVVGALYFGRGGLAPMEQVRPLPPDERPAYLTKACEGDDRLRQRVEQMLAVANEAEAFITDLADETYHARLELTRRGERFEIDARPSDAIALAVRLGVHRGLVYAFLGMAAWLALAKSGIDPVVIGLAMGLGGVAAVVLGAVADAIDLETALYVGAAAPALGCLLCLLLPRPRARMTPVEPSPTPVV